MAITPKVIKIKKIFNDERKFAVLDEQGNRYGGWKDWEGEITDVYYQFTTGGFREGDTVLVNYKTSESNGKVYYNLTGIFRHGESAPSTDPTTPPQNVQPRSNISPTNESREAFGKRLAIHGMVNGMLASGKTPIEIVPELPKLLALEIQIEDALEKGKPAKWYREFNQEDDLNVEDIPF